LDDLWQAAPGIARLNNSMNPVDPSERMILLILSKNGTAGAKSRAILEEPEFCN
jgi:hypothetical protein